MKTKSQYSKETPNYYLERLLTCQTSVIPKTMINKIHELTFHKSVVILEKEPCNPEYVVICRGLKVGSKTKLKLFMKWGTIDLR